MRTANFFDEYNKTLRRLMWSQFLQQVELENERRVRAEAYRDAAKRAIDGSGTRPQD
jgi:hypothetical protein